MLCELAPPSVGMISHRRHGAVLALGFAGTCVRRRPRLAVSFGQLTLALRCQTRVLTSGCELSPKQQGRCAVFSGTRREIALDMGRING